MGLLSLSVESEVDPLANAARSIPSRIDGFVAASGTEYETEGASLKAISPNAAAGHPTADYRRLSWAFAAGSAIQEHKDAVALEPIQATAAGPILATQAGVHECV
ncbi:MAG: hypothetical protein ACI841_004313 [Planctomycetota bacterium]